MESIYHLLTYYDKIPLENYKNCSPFLMDPPIFVYSNKHVYPSYGTLVDSFVWCWEMHNGNKDYYKIHKTFTQIKQKVLHDAVRLDTIKMLAYISKKYNITIKVFSSSGDKPKIFYSNSDTSIELLRIDNRFHLLI